MQIRAGAHSEKLFIVRSLRRSASIEKEGKQKEALPQMCATQKRRRIKKFANREAAQKGKYWKLHKTFAPIWLMYATGEVGKTASR